MIYEIIIYINEFDLTNQTVNIFLYEVPQIGDQSFLLCFQNEDAETVDDCIVTVAKILEVYGDIVVLVTHSENEHESREMNLMDFAMAMLVKEFLEMQSLYNCKIKSLSQ